METDAQLRTAPSVRGGGVSGVPAHHEARARDDAALMRFGDSRLTASPQPKSSALTTSSFTL